MTAGSWWTTATLHTRVVIGQDRYTLTTSRDGLVGMSAPFSLGAPPYVANGVTYVPVALFDALLGEGAVTVTDSGTISIQTPSASSTSLANPFTEYDTLAQAEAAAGFSLQMPDRIPNWMDSMCFRAAENAMIEVIVQGGRSGTAHPQSTRQQRYQRRLHRLRMDADCRCRRHHPGAARRWRLRPGCHLDPGRVYFFHHHQRGSHP